MTEPTSLIAEHWRCYAQSGDPLIRKILIEHYLPYARQVAARVYKRRTDDTVAFDDYLQYARTGLIEAIDRYRPGGAVPFEMYSIHRIRGAVLNGLGDETEKAAQRRAGLSTSIVDRLASLNQSGMGDSSDDVESWMNKVVGLTLGLILEHVSDEPIDETLVGNPYAQVELLFLKRRVMSGLDRLPSREAEVIKLHYFEHMEFQSIAEGMDVSKGRVSQLHASALERLKNLLRDERNIDASL